MPVMAPDLKATSSPAARLFMEAWAVRTLARTETFMPMKPASPDSTAPRAKPIATVMPSRQATSRNSTTPTAPMVVYWRFR
jgi:hypothetical protein